VADEKKTDNHSDVIAVGPVLPNGDITFVRQREEDTGTVIESGTMRVLPEGPPEDKPDDVSDVLRISHLQDNLYRVDEVVHKGGPAMVNSAAYKSGWDTIFGGTQTVGQA
jgi:hypothetical protein